VGGEIVRDANKLAGQERTALWVHDATKPVLLAALEVAKKTASGPKDAETIARCVRFLEDRPPAPVTFLDPYDLSFGCRALHRFLAHTAQHAEAYAANRLALILDVACVDANGQRGKRLRQLIALDRKGRLGPEIAAFKKAVGL
jgi:hypothetical protein